MSSEFRKHDRSRIIRWVLVSTAVLWVGLLASVQTSEWTVRRRAERMLAEFDALTPGVTTWSTLQSLRARWRRWETSDGPCDASRCDFQIRVEDWMWIPLDKVPSIGQFHDYASRTAAILLHDHRPMIWLDVSVRNGKLEDADITEETLVPKGYGPGWEESGPEPKGYEEYKMWDYALIAHSTTVRALDALETANSSHREYMMQPPSGCEGCMGFFTKFGRDAQKQDVAWLTAFDFSCMTRWSPCTRAGELMPEAWRRYKAR